jgi:hypothetical protein
MRNHLGFIALSLLAAAFAGCSSSDKAPTTRSGNGDLTGELAKYNSAIFPLPATACQWTADTGSKTGTVAVALDASNIAVLSLRSVDSALMINGVQCTNNTTAGAIVSKTMIKAMTVAGHTGTDETIIFDYRNGIFGNNAITVDLNTGSVGDEVAVLSGTSNDKVTCSHPASDDAIDADTDKKADITVATQVGTHFTFDLNAGDDTFDQGACVTQMSVYGNIGKDTFSVGTVTSTTGDVFSGGTEALGATAKVDTITFAARTSGVTVNLNGSADDGAASENDNVLDDFEVVTGTAYADTLTSGSTQASYTLNGGDGNDTFASIVDHGAAFNGGIGIDTVDYHARLVGVTVTMDGAKADDGSRSADTYTYDNVAKDIENIIGTDAADKITGNALSNVITPGGGNDAVYGGDGDDRMVSGLVNDQDVVTDAGTTPANNDQLDGNDIFSGGVGSDTVDYSNRLLVATQRVKVTLDSTFNTDGSVKTGTVGGKISGTEQDNIGADVENVWATIGVDDITGSSDANAIYGLGGKDVVAGGAGSDQIDLNSYVDDNANICNPVLLICLDSAATNCNCNDLSKYTATCATDAGSASGVTCGGDSMDILSCKSTALTFADCWKVQS